MSPSPYNIFKVYTSYSFADKGTDPGCVEFVERRKLAGKREETWSSMLRRTSRGSSTPAQPVEKLTRTGTVFTHTSPWNIGILSFLHIQNMNFMKKSQRRNILLQTKLWLNLYPRDSLNEVGKKKFLMCTTQISNAWRLKVVERNQFRRKSKQFQRLYVSQSRCWTD